MDLWEFGGDDISNEVLYPQSLNDAYGSEALILEDPFNALQNLYPPAEDEPIADSTSALDKQVASLGQCPNQDSLLQEGDDFVPPLGMKMSCEGISKNEPPSVGKAGSNGSKLPREAVQALKNWLREHADHPYPTEAERDNLLRETGLKKEQVCNWLANARRRSKLRYGPPMAQAYQYALSGNCSSNPINIATPVDVSYENLGPLDRWRVSPPELEPAPISAIADAVSSSTDDLMSPFMVNFQDAPYSAGGSCGVSLSRVSSTSSLELARSTGSESSFGSERSYQSYNSCASRSSRNSFGSVTKEAHRRRRKPVRKPASRHSFDIRRYQCTFCTDAFKTKYDWQRHEMTLHLSLDRWQCSPHGPTNDNNCCVFCGHQDPDAHHLETHNYRSCAEKEPHERIFYRKDHMRQHLRLFHNSCKYYAPTMDNWAHNMHEFPSRCGFCDAQFQFWTERADHLSAHFRQGVKMDDWKGDRGFPKQIEAVVTNAIPPYLIGAEGKTLEPFSASNDAHRFPQESIPPGGLNAMQYCVQNLENQLKSYVMDEIRRVHTPTDQEIQDRARMLVFEDVDSWNQTRADAPEWMMGFKQQVGLVPSGDIPGRNVYIGAKGGPTFHSSVLPVIEDSWMDDVELELPDFPQGDEDYILFGP